MKKAFIIAIAMLLLTCLYTSAAFAGNEEEIVISAYAANPFTPEGTGTVTDHASGDGKEFYTITAPDETVFYLVIDRQRGAENVYFLNEVTAEDLISLAKLPESSFPAGTFETAPPAPAPEISVPGPGKESKKTARYVFIAAAALIFGSALWHFKTHDKKHQRAGDSEYGHPDPEDDDYTSWYDEESENKNE